MIKKNISIKKNIFLNNEDDIIPAIKCRAAMINDIEKNYEERY